MFIYVNAKQMVGNPSLVKTRLARQILGTAFGGELPIGLTLGQLLNRSFDQIKRPQFRF